MVLNKNYTNVLKGVGLTVLLAIPAWYFGLLLPIIGGPVFGIVIGICLSFAPIPASFGAGIKFSSKTLLKAGVILLGFEMNMGSLMKVGAQSIVVMLCTIAVSFATAFLVGRCFKLKGDTPTLIGIGTAICGGSAIAAASSVIDASDEDISYAMSTIFLFNIIAVFLFPLIGHITGMSDSFFGMWAGTAVNDTSSVLAAGYSYSNAAGEFATIVKLARTLMIIPVTLLLSLVVAKQKSKTANFNFIKIFPWFVGGFIIASIVKTHATFLPEFLMPFLGNSGRVLIITALIAIGLNTNIKQMKSAGLKPAILGLCCWAAVSVSSIIVQLYVG